MKKKQECRKSWNLRYGNGLLFWKWFLQNCRKVSQFVGQETVSNSVEIVSCYRNCRWQPPVPPPRRTLLFSVLNGQNVKMAWIVYTKQNKMKNKCPLHIIFQVLEVLLIKICKSNQSHQIFYLLLHAFISFYIHFTSADTIFHKF